MVLCEMRDEPTVMFCQSEKRCRQRRWDRSVCEWNEVWYSCSSHRWRSWGKARIQSLLKLDWQQDRAARRGTIYLAWLGKHSAKVCRTKSHNSSRTQGQTDQLHDFLPRLHPRGGRGRGAYLVVAVLCMCGECRFTHGHEEGLEADLALHVLGGLVDFFLRLGLATCRLGIALALLLCPTIIPNPTPTKQYREQRGQRRNGAGNIGIRWLDRG